MRKIITGISLIALSACTFAERENNSAILGKWVNTRLTEDFAIINLTESQPHITFIDGTSKPLEWNLQNSQLHLIYADTINTYEVSYNDNSITLQRKGRSLTLLPYSSFMKFSSTSNIEFYLVSQFWQVNWPNLRSNCFMDFEFPNVYFQTCEDSNLSLSSNKFSWKTVFVDSLMVLQLKEVFHTSIFISQFNSNRIDGFFYNDQYQDIDFVKVDTESSDGIISNLSATWLLNTEVAPYLEKKVPLELELSNDESGQMYSVEFSNDRIQLGDWNVGQSGHLLVFDVDSDSKLLWFEIQDLSDELLRLRIDGNTIEYRKIE